MLRDQVRRSKKTHLRVSPRSAKAPIRAKNVAPSRRKTTSHTTHGRNSLLLLGIFSLLILSLWYGFSHIFSYLTLAPVPRLTLLIQQNDSIWLLAESREQTPQYFKLSPRSELASGMTSGLTWSQLVIELTKATTPQKARTMASQTLGVPIDRIVEIGEGEGTWTSVVRQLRERTLSAVRSGGLADQSLQLWLVARQSEGSEEPQALASIVTHISRQNLAAITGKENCPVAVLNNSGTAGFASLVGAMLEQNGGTVLRVANALSVGEVTDLGKSTTTILTNPQTATQCPRTLATLNTFFATPLRTENSAVTDQYRASLVIILGQDARQLPTTVVVPNLHQ